MILVIINCLLLYVFGSVCVELLEKALWKFDLNRSIRTAAIYLTIRESTEKQQTDSAESAGLEKQIVLPT